MSRTPPADCAHCAAVCCRLTVVLEATDEVPPELVATIASGQRTMAHADDGYCLALRDHRCSIYATRPQACRRFVMDGPYCRSERAQHAGRHAIPLRLRETSA